MKFTGLKGCEARTSKKRMEERAGQRFGYTLILTHLDPKYLYNIVLLTIIEIASQAALASSPNGHQYIRLDCLKVDEEVFLLSRLRCAVVGELRAATLCCTPCCLSPEAAVVVDAVLKRCAASSDGNRKSLGSCSRRSTSG